MNKVIFVILLLSVTAFAQQKFDIKNASKNYDVKIEVTCENSTCRGKVKYSIYKKGKTKPLQIFNLAESGFLLKDNRFPSINTSRLYDEQSAVNFGDFNFDGIEDLALNDGRNSGYSGASYQIYLFSPQSKKFVRNQSFTNLAQGVYLGMFEVDNKRKVLRTSSKSGCCWHQTREFTVVGNRPKKVLEITEDATIADETKVTVTTRKLVGGKWRSSVKKVKRED